MDNVVGFEAPFLKKFAKSFVDVYEEADDGVAKAGAFAVETLTQEQIIKAQPYVTQEFLDRGYTFPNTDEEDMI